MSGKWKKSAHPGPDEAKLFIDAFNLLPGGNFHEEASGRLTGHNILHVRQPLRRWLTGRGRSAGSGESVGKDPGQALQCTEGSESARAETTKYSRTGTA